MLDADDADGKTVTASASGCAEAEPDQAVVRVSVEATATDPTVAPRRVAENATEMRDALVEPGLPADSIRTAGFDVYEERVRPPEPDHRPRTVYRARHAFAIEVDDTARTGGLDRGRPVPVLAAADGGTRAGTSIESGPVSVATTVPVTYNVTG